MVTAPPELTALPLEKAIVQLKADSWIEIGRGDWSWVFAHPTDPIVARITPFDPAHLMFAQDCLSGPANRWLPKIHAIHPLEGDAYAVLMERLWPADEPLAERLCATLGIPNDCGYFCPEAQPPACDDTELHAARARIENTLRLGRMRYRLWGGSDVRPGNVMQDASGQLKFVDAVFLAGPRLLEAIRLQSRQDLADFTVAQLEAFLTIPAFQNNRASASEIQELRRLVGRL